LLAPRYWRDGRQNTRLDIKAGAAKLKADRAARLEAELVIDRWKRRLATGRDMLWSPTIRAALVAGTPWLDVICPGAAPAGRSTCERSTAHPLASVDTLVLGASGLLCESQRKKGPCPAQTADSAPRLTLSTGWPHCLGIGGRFRSEWVAAFRRNRWPHCLGFRTLHRRERGTRAYRWASPLASARCSTGARGHSARTRNQCREVRSSFRADRKGRGQVATQQTASSSCIGAKRAALPRRSPLGRGLERRSWHA
jgi:hypothetical protein